MAACFRYKREYAISVREFCAFVSIDDKHKIKVGEPGYPVAIAEHGRRVLVCDDEFFEFGDNDFIKLSVVPSAAFIINISEEISKSKFSGTLLIIEMHVHFVLHAVQLCISVLF